MTVWRGHLFGLGIDSELELAGCRPSGVPPELPRTRVSLAQRRELARRWPADAHPVGWRGGASGERVPDVLAHPTAGYRMPAPGFGTFQIDPGGERILAAPNAVPLWRWQRYLLGRVLPFAAALQGLEPMHASAVSCPAGVVLLAGDPGAGKTTLAAELVLRGMPLVADDVAALQVRDRVVVAHPGPGLIWLRRPSAQRLGARALQRLGERVGADTRGIRLSVRREQTARPVSAVYLLSPAAGEVTRSALGAARAPALLAHTFNAVLRQPDRLVRQLDVYATLASSVPVVRFGAPRGADTGALAELIAAELETLG